jgi:RNA polymerase sigma-70 factor (ECF subfamily)
VRDEAAFRALFDVEYPRLVRELRVVLGDPALAEDVAADAFEALLRSWSKVSRYDRPGAWLRLVALRAAGKARGRRARRPVVESTWQPTASDTDAVDVDLQRALLQLTLHQRTAIVLHHLSGFPARDIADVLECDEVTVRTHLLRGRRRLAELLGDPDLEEVNGAH